VEAAGALATAESQCIIIDNRPAECSGACIGLWRGGKAGVHSAVISLLQRPMHMLVKAEALIAAAESERLALLVLCTLLICAVRRCVCCSRSTFNALAEAAKRASIVVNWNDQVRIKLLEVVSNDKLIQRNAVVTMSNVLPTANFPSFRHHSMSVNVM
jgi:hypothetical protein